MAKCCGDDLTYSFGKLDNNSDGKYDLVERIPHAFDKMYLKPCSIYTLDSAPFEDIKTGFNEVVSKIEVPVLKEKQYPNCFDVIKQLADAGKINIYF